MTTIAPGWNLTVEHGPDWTFARLEKSVERADPEPPIAEAIWNAARAHKPPQVVFEIAPGVILFSQIIGQLVLIHKRIHTNGGQFRICGFDENNYQVLEMLQLADRFYNYPDRAAAVMGHKEMV